MIGTRSPKEVKKKTPLNQTLDNWLKTFEKEVLPDIRKERKLCFVAHSLGPVFVLHVVEKYNIMLDSAVFVSPFMCKLGKSWQIDHVNRSFYKTSFDFSKLKKLIPVSYVLYSDNDPYVDKKFSLEFAQKLKSSLLFVKGAGHMNEEIGMKEFPLVFELCKSALDFSIYRQD